MIGESLAEYSFGGLTTLMHSGKEFADSLVFRADHWTLSTKSDGEDDRAARFSAHLKKIKKAVIISIRQQIKASAKIDSSLVEIDKSKVER